jgi:hypothetical protein
MYASGVIAQPETLTQKIPDRYIVVFEGGVRRAAAVANGHARENGLQLKFVYTSAIEGLLAERLLAPSGYAPSCLEGVFSDVRETTAYMSASLYHQLQNIPAQNMT